MAKLTKGTVLSFCGGRYSDKWTSGPFDILKDFDQAEVVADYKASYAGKVDLWGDEEEGDEGGFIAFLASRGFICDVDESYSWYVGDGYGGDFEPVIA